MNNKRYSVIIVGAGLAGLSVARGLKNVDRVLIVDKKPIGSRQNPPHETLVPYIEHMGYKDAIVQRFRTMDIRTSIGTYTLKLFQPHCTLDYTKLCELIFVRGSAEFRPGNVEPVDENRVKVDGETLEADFIVDCSGWRAIIASTLAKDDFGPVRMTTAMATTVPFKSSSFIDSPTYFFDPRIITNGGGFVIPFGDQALVGLGSYVGKEELSPNLSKLLKTVGVKPGLISRFFIPNHGLRPQTVGSVFLVGDAAGQTKPVRGKGILRGTYYGLKCGELIRQVIDGHRNLEQAKTEYHDYIMHEKPVYTIIKNVQSFLSYAPSSMQSFLAASMANDIASFFWDKMY
jgi:flavin-dependent dehydrogenase